MSKVYDKPVQLQRQDADTEEWIDVLPLPLHASVNKATNKQDVDFGADADQFHARMVFEFRYTTLLETTRYSPQIYRLVYRGHTYRIVDYDDYMEQHREVRITGEQYEQ